MNNENNHINSYTAADIEKYHKGLLSAKERHALEKAALDDPFLADALEGYSVAGVNAGADIIELKNRLAEKTAEAKIIPLHHSRTNSFRLLRAAVVIAFIAGAGLLVYQFGFNKKTVEIAETDTTKTGAGKENDTTYGSTNIPVTTEFPIVGEDKKTTATSTTTQNNGPVTSKDKITVPSSTTKDVVGEASEEPRRGIDNVAPVATTTNPSINPPAKTAREKNDDLVAGKTAENKDAVRDELKKQSAGTDKNRAVTKDVAAGQPAKEGNEQRNNRAVTANRQAEDLNNRNQATNIFRGRVTDASNVGVPFANVTSVPDQVGTYTDARGYFNLTAPDTVLNVQVRSIGFEENNVQLRNSVSNTQVVLQDDRRSLSEVVVSNQKPNASARSRNNNIKLEEPEPADGWDNYDSYLANNLKAPEDFKAKESKNRGVVEVSFEVDKHGEPTNIKIERSLCSTCDKEAIRLIKEGPKWKRKAKKGRTTVTINF